MSADFEHVIMTRFNLATPGRESSLRNRPGWLAERFELFERYCLPSIAAQTVKAFNWIIYFDENTPEEFRRRIERCREVTPFLPYYTGVFPATGWAWSIHESYAFAPRLLLTTRLDNDDALAVDYVERVQEEIRRRDLQPGGYNLLHGFIMGGGAVYRLAHPSNAFFSFLAPYETEVVTAPSILHMELSKHGPVTQIGGPGAWLQIVHGGNVSNKIRGARVAPETVVARFPPDVTAGLRPVGFLARGAENLVPGSLRAARDLALSLRRRLHR